MKTPAFPSHRMSATKRPSSDSWTLPALPMISPFPDQGLYCRSSRWFAHPRYRDATSPQEIGFVDTPGEAWGVAVSGSLAYVADGKNGLLVVNAATRTP